MTRDELQDVATRVCLAIAAGADVADVFDDARSVAVALAHLALDNGALLDRVERRRSDDRRRQERRRAKQRDSVTPESRTGHGDVTRKNVTERDKTVTETVTKGVTTRDIAPPQTPLPDEHPPSSADSDGKEGENARARADARSRAGHGDVTASVTPKTVTERDGYDTRWCALLKVFERVVHNGMDSVPQAIARLHLTNLLPALDARAKGKPLEYFEAVLVPYARAKSERGDVADLQYFCRDFAKWADKPKGPVAAPEDSEDRAQRIRTLRAQLQTEELGADFGDTPEERAQHKHKADALRAELEQLTTRAA